MATAVPQHASGYNTLATHVLEHWYNKDKAEDVIFDAIPLLQIVSQLPGVVVKRTLPHDILVRFQDVKANGAQPFAYYDTVNTDPSRGSQAMRFGAANYHVPITMSWHEEMEFTSDEAFADWVEEYTQLAEMTLAEMIAEDLYGGNSANSKRMNGLEDCLAAVADHLTSATSKTDATNVNQRIVYPWQLRQQDSNVYGGVTRLDHDAANTGTGIEGNVFTFNLGTTTGSSFALSSGSMSEGLKRFTECYYASTNGGGNMTPDLCIMGDQPYQDLEEAMWEKTNFERVPSAYNNVEISSDNMTWKGMVIIRDPRCVNKNAVSGVATLGYPNIYMLNTSTWKFFIDSRADFALTDSRQPQNQIAQTRGILFRGNFICKNPRFNTRMTDYPAT
jgi:hypothetical protein